MALVPLVNSEDRIIGFKERSLLEETDCWRITALWIINSHGEALVTRRSKLKKYGAGLFDLSVAGTVEGEDSYYDTIVREIKEELGIELNNPIVPTIKDQFKNRERGMRICQWFIAKEDLATSTLVLQPEEVDEAFWMPIPQLIIDITQHPLNYVSHIGLEVLKSPLIDC